MTSDAEDRNRKARIRSGSTIVQRTSRASGAIAIAMQQEAIEVDKMGHEVALSSYNEAKEHLEGALSLVNDCIRSAEGDR